MSDAPSQEPSSSNPRSPDSGVAHKSIFRREAIEHHVGAQREAHLLALTPTWTRLAYWLLLAVCSIALLYAILGRVNEYASGMAVFQSEGRTDVTAHAGGTVDVVDVRPGQRVQAGQILARLYSAAEAAELDRIDRELELQLIKTLRDPSDIAARSTITSLRAQRELAASRLDERTLRAPQDGIISDVRIRPGQELQPGDVALSLLGQDAGFRVIAVLPGQYRPLVKPGMPLRLELQGFPYAYQSVLIETVSDEVVGPAEVRRYLRQPVADSWEFKGPSVLVEARMQGRSFTVQGQDLSFYDGMLARAEVAVRSESILITLIPGLRWLLTDHGDRL